MAPTKLTDVDRQDILSLYRETDETSSTIAERYGVSNSTISRILKQSLPADEYEELIQQKRSGPRSQVDEDIESVDEPAAEAEPTPEVEPEPEPENEKPRIPAPRKRRRSNAEASDQEGLASEPALPLFSAENFVAAEPTEKPEEPSTEVLRPVQSNAIQEIFEDEILHPEDFGGDLEDEEDDDEEDVDEEDDDLDDATIAAAFHVSSGAKVQVLPLSEATIPKTFYLVVDRSSELITRPLRDFAELGQIPEEDIQARTLPIFDNHHIARRFMRRMQRVVKVPDGRMLTKVGPYLQAKGISRLLIDGQIYSL